ncbi:MAG: diacylglycerol/lipid kinase family protein [Bacteroidales bacterium]
MNPLSRSRIWFVVNPIAGNSQKEEFPEFVNRTLDHALYQYEIKYTNGPGHAVELGKEAAASGIEMVVAVGGDGTINEVARGLIHTETVLGIIPRGSGNGLARHLNIPLNFEGALKLINTGRKLKIDTGTINGNVFVSIAGVGFDALVADQFAKEPGRGFITYFKIVAGNYQNYVPEEYTIILDNNQIINTSALFVTLANSNQFGYNTTIAPEAKLNDGLFDVCIVEKPNIFEMPVIINLMLLKMIHKSRYVTIHKSAGIKIIRHQNAVVNIDGEPIILDKELDIKILPLSLNVIIP